MQGKLIAIIDIASSSKIKHNYTDGRGGASTGVITIQHIRFGDGDDNGAGSSKSGNANDLIVLSSSSLYWGITTKKTKEDIPQQRVVCVKNKCVPEGSRYHDIHHANATEELSQTFGAANRFLPKNLEGESESTNYTDIKSEYVGNLAKIKLLEACIMAYDTRDPFSIPTLEYEYSGAVEDRWVNRATTGVYLLSHWLKVSLRVASQSQRDYYKNCSEDEDIISCESTKTLFVNSSDPALIKMVEEKYESLDRLTKGRLST